MLRGRRVPRLTPLGVLLVSALVVLVVLAVVLPSGALAVIAATLALLILVLFLGHPPVRIDYPVVPSGSRRAQAHRRASRHDERTPPHYDPPESVGRFGE